MSKIDLSEYEKLEREVEDLAENMGVSCECASDIKHFRKQSWWNDRLEAELILRHRNGISVEERLGFGKNVYWS